MLVSKIRGCNIEFIALDLLSRPWGHQGAPQSLLTITLLVEMCS